MNNTDLQQNGSASYPQPRVSVVIPCHNAAPHLAEAIESALNQTYRPLEVIVIDDGSTDGSLEVLQSFGDAIRFESGPNRGPSAARNRGVELAQGELIQFLDADDVLQPHKLATQVPFAIRNKPAITYCDYETRVRDQPQQVNVHSQECGKTDPVFFIVQNPSLQTAAPLHWKSVFQQFGGFRDELWAAEEYELHIRLACNGYRFVHLPEILYTLYTTPGSITSNYYKIIDAMHSVLCSVVDHLDETGGLTSIRRLALAQKLAAKARNCFDKGLDELGTRCFATACRVHPSAYICISYPRAVRKLRRLCGLPVTERLLALLGSLRSVSNAIAKREPQSSV